MVRRRLIRPTTDSGVLKVYETEDKIAIVERRGENVITRYAPAEHVTFFDLSDVPPKMLRALREDHRVTAVTEQGAFLRVALRTRDECFQVARDFEAAGWRTYEADVGPTRRWMVENNPRRARPRLGFVDLETDSRVPFSKKETARTLCWALVREDGSKVSDVLASDTDAAERRLYQSLWAALSDVDVVLAWNGDRFDFPVIDARTTKLKIASDKHRWLWLDQLEAFKRMNAMAAESGEEKTSFALNAIAQALGLGGKDAFDASKTWQAWAAGGEERDRLVRYCERDTDLLRLIEQKTGYVGLLNTLCELTHVFPDTRGLQPTNQAEGYLLRLAFERGVRFPSKLSRRRASDKYAGAYVMEPDADGILTGIHVADFASLYPSIIVTWNMSPETITSDKEGTSDAPYTGHRFRVDEEGLLPSAVKDVMRLRKEWTAKKNALPPGSDAWVDANRKATAYKIAANSFYGVMGSENSRFFDRRVAESVSQAGKWLILLTIEEAERRGMKAVYGDTDSVFVGNVGREEFAAFVEHCNTEVYPEALRARGCRENLIVLAYEKEFERVVFTSAKRYVGRYAHYKGTAADGSSKPEIKGLEYKRGDSIRLARRFQAEVIDLLVGGGVTSDRRPTCEENPDVFLWLVQTWLDRILTDAVELSDVVQRKGLSRPLDDYSRRKKQDGEWSRQGPHIELAREMMRRGADVGEGSRVEFFCYDASDKKGGKEYRLASDWTGELDRYELWENQVWPPTARLLAAAFPRVDWAGFKRVRPKAPRRAANK